MRQTAQIHASTVYHWIGNTSFGLVSVTSSASSYRAHSYAASPSTPSANTVTLRFFIPGNPRSTKAQHPSGHYHVEDWDRPCLQPSKVRNCVLSHISRYMHHNSVDLLWIDAHCIQQDTCGVAACDSHIRCIQKREVLQAMDLVYQRSELPVALLGRPLQTDTELSLLQRILSGNLVDGRGSESRLSGRTTIQEARESLRLLHEITQDKWWGRAWTFQENYRGRTQMRLLICHDPSLERQKLGYRVFGDIPDELCVNSVEFSKQATRLCLALRRAGRSQGGGIVAVR